MGKRTLIAQAVIAGLTLLLGFGRPLESAQAPTAAALAGVWVSEAHPDELLQIGPDGRYSVYHLWRAYGLYEIQRLGSLSGSRGELALEDAFGLQAAPSEQVGRYQARLGADDSLRLEPLAPDDAARAAYLQPERPFRRVAGLDALVGAWADARAQQVVVFGRDLTFELYRADQPYDLGAIESGLYWPQDGQLYLLAGSGASYRCEPLAAALYDLELHGPGELVLRAARETCPHRRQALDGRALTRVAAVERLVGRWSAAGWVLRIHCDATYDLVAAPASARGPVAQGRLWLTPDGLRLRDAAGPGACLSAASAAELDRHGRLLTTPLAGQCRAADALHARARAWRPE